MEAGGVTSAWPAHLKVAARVGAEARRGRTGRTDGGDDEGFVTQDGVTRVGIRVTENEHTPTLLGQVAIAGDDAGDGDEI